MDKEEFNDLKKGKLEKWNALLKEVFKKPKNILEEALKELEDESYRCFFTPFQHDGYVESISEQQGKLKHINDAYNNGDIQFGEKDNLESKVKRVTRDQLKSVITDIKKKHNPLIPIPQPPDPSILAPSPKPPISNLLPPIPIKPIVFTVSIIGIIFVAYAFNELIPSWSSNTESIAVYDTLNVTIESIPEVIAEGEVYANGGELLINSEGNQLAIKHEVNHAVELTVDFHGQRLKYGGLLTDTTLLVKPDYKWLDITIVRPREWRKKGEVTIEGKKPKRSKNEMEQLKVEKYLDKPFAQIRYIYLDYPNHPYLFELTTDTTVYIENPIKRFQVELYAPDEGKLFVNGKRVKPEYVNLEKFKLPVSTLPFESYCILEYEANVGTQSFKVSSDTMFRVSHKPGLVFPIDDSRYQLVARGNGFCILDRSTKQKTKKLPFVQFSTGFREGLIAAKNKTGKWGYINYRGEIVISFQFTDASDFKKGKAYVKKNEKYYTVNIKGEIRNVQ